MLPSMLIQIALIVIVGRSVYRFITLFRPIRKDWIELAFHASVALVALSFLL
ncbi:hypothetical protein [Paenibacillus hexagrammi]|uniref:Uncharacterized protein n=1 Tax=Paenibacillus hexagrammi TaxID=2908839 RepID=A0ABY3SI26_9BACL|nr:hypothetical protein [Paenibacillus sp. YPD9-1]UJF33611.1 hypothetical protein L0M14_29710 [Paenibacillus sp. YPD9-1]